MTALLIGGHAQASVVFSDTTYDPLNYSSAFNYNGVGSTSVFAAVPGTGLTFTMATNGAVNAPAILQGVLNTTFVYNPTIQGAITSISASSLKTFSATNTDPSAGSIAFNNNFRPLVEQDGKFYAAAIPGTPLGPISGGQSLTTGPQTLSNVSLTANDFLLIDPSTGVITGATGLNFAGDTITFGVVQLLNSSGTSATALTTYSDLSIGVTSTSTVPLPGAAPMFGAALLAFGGFGYRLKRRKAAAAA